MIPNLLARIARIIDGNPALLAVSVLLLAIALFAVLFGILWALHHLTGVFGEVQWLAKELDVDTRSLLEFIGLFVGVTILVGQFWLTHRRITAAENTATAAQETAASTVLSHSAQQFREAVESLSSPSVIVRLGGLQALGIMARNYPEYQDAIANIIAEYGQQEGQRAGIEE